MGAAEMVTANGQVAPSGTGGSHGDGGLPHDPVFVLCMARSGSTLLRLILDTHPDLACPPETSIPALCGQLAVVWSLIEGAPLSPRRGDAPPEIPDAAIAGIRQTMDLMTAPYLARRGKRLLCDKSLSTAKYAELLVRIYPQARFICLYRHPMDMISSGIEACPFGLNGYGFDQYIADSPGNAVLALARYWHDEATAITSFEGKYPDRCHRVRYEDMVREPDRIAARVFSFIGVDPAPGIAEAVFSHQHERFGPGDHKVWHTSSITPDSIGRSEAVPTGLILPPILAAINELAGRLGYVAADEKWGTADMPASLLLPGQAQENVAVPAYPGRGPVAAMLADRLQAGISRIGGQFTSQWQACMAEVFTVAVRQPQSLRPQRWNVDLGARTLAPAVMAGSDDLDTTVTDADWSIVGTEHVWQEVLTGGLNLSVALRRCELRYCDTGESGASISENRVAMLAALLGLTSWKPGPGTAAQFLTMAEP